MLRLIKDIRTRNILAVGAVVVVTGMLVVPSSALAGAFKYTGIEGSNLNKADVTAGGQLLTTETDPGTGESFVDSGSFSSTSSDTLGMTNAGNYFAVVTQLQINTSADPSPGSNASVTVRVNTTAAPAYDTLASVNPPSVGDIVIPVSPGLPAQQTDGQNSLQVIVHGTGLDVTVIASGYFMPCSDGSGYCS